MTARGRPSGTATTMMVIPTIRYLNQFPIYVPIFSSQLYPAIPYSMKNLTKRTKTVMAAETIPTFPISVAIASNFS